MKGQIPTAEFDHFSTEVPRLKCCKSTATGNLWQKCGGTKPAQKHITPTVQCPTVIWIQNKKEPYLTFPESSKKKTPAGTGWQVQVPNTQNVPGFA